MYSMLRALLLALLVGLWLPVAAPAQDLQSVLQAHQAQVAKPSRKSVSPVLESLAASGLPSVTDFLERWQNKELYVRKADGLFYYAEPDGDVFTLTDPGTGETAGTAAKSELAQIKPNGGVRKAISEALVQFQLSDPDINRRSSAVDAIARSMNADQLAPLTAAIENEPDPALKARKIRVANMLAASFAKTTEERVAAIKGLEGDLSVDSRGVLNLILTKGDPAIAPFPDGAIVAQDLTPGTDELSVDAAYDLMVAAGKALPILSAEDRLAILRDNVEDGRVGGILVGQLNTQDGRDRAYTALVDSGVIQDEGWNGPATSKAEYVATEKFASLYSESDPAVIEAARTTLDGIETRVKLNQFGDLALDALSLASIYFLAAIGLAITFGVMGVINMAHGEFIMMGAYTGYVVQQFVPNYTASIIVALPLAFAVTFAAGVAMERLVIRWLYHRPLETLLATFGISIALQQLAKNIFGTQARPLTSPSWLDGAWIINDVIQIAYIRIAIFVLAVIFLGLILFILKRTRLGLEVRAVTQNPGMAASMGINPDRINMLTFGLGSGIAGIAGVAIGLYAKVTSEMGADYIVQSFMTVVVGGVGNVWGTLAGATMIGTLQKGIEFLNPSNTLAAQTYMILFIILFIQFRPKGIVALKGRAAGD